MKHPGKKKLQKFEQYAGMLLPHEAGYLLHVSRLNDPEKMEILKQVVANTNLLFHPVPYSGNIDKRKYSYLMRWMQEKLDKVDADKYYQWLTALDLKIMTDSISAEEEKELIKAVSDYTCPNYYFIRFYELVQNFRNYLLIRMRYTHMEITGRFLTTFREKYLNAQVINHRLHQATGDIVAQYSEDKIDTRHWEDWLISVFNDEELDGLNRYFAIVRLTFLYYNYKEYGKLTELYHQLDRLIVEGKIYSRRILANYYANRVFLHIRQNEPEEAEKYGYLSIRYKSADYLFYVNNLAAVLLRNNKKKEALKLMQDNLSELRSTISPHTRVGFVSYYIRILNKNGMARQALSFAESFLASDKPDILKNQWHTFFVSMLQSMIMLEKYRKLLTLARWNRLEVLEESIQYRAGYIPTLRWYIYLAQYKELEIHDNQLVDYLIASARPFIADEHKRKRILELADEIGLHAPELLKQVVKCLSL